MKDAKFFLIVSLILHLLILVLLGNVTLSPPDNIGPTQSPILVDMVKAKPILPDIVTQQQKVKKVKQSEPEAPPESPQVVVPPAPEPLPPLPADTKVISARTAFAKKEEPVRAEARRLRFLPAKPPRAKHLSPCPISDYKAKILSLQTDGDDLSASTSISAYSADVGPIAGNAATRGIGEYYVNALYSTSIGRQKSPGDEFGTILPELAQRIMSKGGKKKKDIVFVLDATGSMRDNARGVKDYIERFLEPMKSKGLDVALGLVKFGDQEIHNAEVQGTTRNPKKFKKWIEKMKFFGGGDIPESGYEALMAALKEVKFRKDAQKIFVFVSDAPQHDLDFDGKSRYTLDRVLAGLAREHVTVHVIGIRYRPLHLLARGTGGTWVHIPGGDLVDDIPLPASNMIKSQLGRALPFALVRDRVTVQFKESVPDWIDLSYKMLDPSGFKCLGTLTYRKKVKAGTDKKVEFSTVLDLSKFEKRPGIYTLIYRIRDSAGNYDVLRRTLELGKASG